MTTRIARNTLGPNSHWADQTDQTLAKNQDHRLSADTHILKARLASIKFRPSITGEESSIVVFDSIYSVAQSQFTHAKQPPKNKLNNVIRVHQRQHPRLGKSHNSPISARPLLGVPDVQLVSGHFIQSLLASLAAQRSGPSKWQPIAAISARIHEAWALGNWLDLPTSHRSLHCQWFK